MSTKPEGEMKRISFGFPVKGFRIEDCNWTRLLLMYLRRRQAVEEKIRTKLCSHTFLGEGKHVSLARYSQGRRARRRRGAAG